MISRDQVVERILKRKEWLLLTVKAVLVFTMLWAVLFYMYALSHAMPFAQLNKVANAIQLFCGLIIGIQTLVYARFSQEYYLVLGIALGVLSWTLGQLYWFSYLLLEGPMIPCLSIGDLGFISIYFFLIGVMRTITNRIPKYTIVIKYRDLWPLALLVVPIFIALVGECSQVHNLDNFAMTLAIVYLLWKAQPIYTLPKYQLFLSGIGLLCLSDIIYMLSAVLFPEGYTLTTEALFPIALSLTAYGFMKVEEMSDG
ncbi:hypothetical protein Desdi_0636 [Desulfitobacterium dichloroeliminans LMG P-21439]|uniref:YhhN-like protein n=1 Tax=Desulfitobacterium dichloroeliminans (strain LMG P-21439 / DCA1) TaxID=871963 RepID=L0F557_DESDL|nr:hypothetical protein [Desulfitobacterium dichloroeliminans]AGA68165.1 hypothetical protein Desdi_0636 [Desulfitobacterium dichloroeliminans LMG P-21439]